MVEESDSTVRLAVQQCRSSTREQQPAKIAEEK
jgi:hypothetical protein